MDQVYIHGPGKVIDVLIEAGAAVTVPAELPPDVAVLDIRHDGPAITARAVIPATEHERAQLAYYLKTASRPWYLTLATASARRLVIDLQIIDDSRLRDRNISTVFSEPLELPADRALTPAEVVSVLLDAEHRFRQWLDVLAAI